MRFRNYWLAEWISSAIGTADVARRFDTEHLASKIPIGSERDRVKERKLLKIPLHQRRYAKAFKRTVLSGVF
jgi:hypothetical protein